MKKQLRIIFIVIGMILIPLITNAQVPMTDTFDGATLNTGIWEFVDPVDDCSVILNNGNAEISIPAGTSHDLHFDLAPRLLQTISNEDFTVQIKFDSAPAAQYQMQGFIVQTTNNAARLRFETYFGSEPYFYVNTYGVTVIGLPINQAIGGAIPQYLKLDRTGNVWTFDYSYDGSSWYNVSTYTLGITVEKVGFYGANHTPNPAFIAMADYFWNLDQPLPVNLSSFTAIYANSTPILHWTTQSENSNLGWNVYRSFSQNLGQASQINNELIPGAGTTSEPTDYQFTDEYDVIVGQTYWYWLESISGAGETESYGSVSLTIPNEGNDIPEIPLITELHQNFPNPFNPSTLISFDIKENETGVLSVYNIKGQLIVKDEFEAGRHYYDWDARDNSSGVYLYKLQTESYMKIIKMLLVK